MTDDRHKAREAPVVQFGPFRLDRQERVLLRGSEDVPLTPKAFDLLDVLIRNAGSLVEKDVLLRSVWPDTVVDETNLSHHIFVLRKALGDDRTDYRYIQTVPRRGYRFIAEVAPAEDGGDSPVSTAPPDSAEGSAVTERGPRWRSRKGIVIAAAVAVIVALAT